MELSIILINWNSYEFCIECIKSIRSTTYGVDYEIIVVDNASSDDSCEFLISAAPFIKFIRSQENLGFAKGNNLGAANASAPTLLFLNPDTLVLGDAINRMLARLNASDDIGAVGCRLLNSDSTLQMSCVQRLPSISSQLLSIDWCKHRWPKLPLWGMQALFTEDPSGTYEVEMVSGACLMVKRDVFESVDQFSREYFMYAEEADLCQKIRRAGRKICHVPDAHIVHFGGQSTQKRGASFADVAMRQSVFMFLVKWKGHAYAWSYRLALLFSAGVRLILLSGVLLLPKRVANHEGALRSFKKWRNIAVWSLSWG